ncbi:MAG: alpha/beta fold hydrolase [Pseudomonadota bacterium]
MPRKMLTAAAILLAAYAGLCALLFFNQRSLLYFPQPRAPIAGATTMALPTEAGPVLVTVRARSGPNALVYFGGNAEDVTYNLPGFAAAFPDHAIYLLHYRGYGGSAGTPTQAALFADAVALFDKVRTDHGNIVAIGRSLGSGVAVHLASVRPVSRLVLVTPYNSIRDLAAQQFPYVPVRWLMRDRYESWKYAQQVTVPTLLVMAEHDEVIPRASTEGLHRYFRAGTATLGVISGAGHNTLSGSPEYMQLLRMGAGY